MTQKVPAGMLDPQVPSDLGLVMNGKIDKGAAYTLVAADKGKVINATTGTWSLTLTAAATLGDGFTFCVLNSGAGTITIDPNASETIDGATTKVIGPGKLAIVYCDGTKFTTIGSIATGPGSGLDADTLDGYHASAFQAAGTYLTSDVGHGNVGSFCFAARMDMNTTGITVGSTYSGSILQASGFYVDSGSLVQISTAGAALSGTWRALGSVTPVGGSNGSPRPTLFQRIS